MIINKRKSGFELGKKEEKTSLKELYESEAIRIEKKLAELDPLSEEYMTLLSRASTLSNSIAKFAQAKESEEKARATRIGIISDIGANIGSMGLDAGMKGIAMAFESNGGAFTTFTTKKISSSPIKPMKSRFKIG